MIKLKLLIEEIFGDMDSHVRNDDINDFHKSLLLKKLDEFTDSYIEAALWSSMDNLQPNGGEFLDKKYTIDDIDLSTIEKMTLDCKNFKSKYSELYNSGGWSDVQAGHDFWLSRNGHGSGFFDRNWYDNTEDIGKKLQTASKSYGPYDLYLGDGQYDGIIFGSKG